MTKRRRGVKTKIAAAASIILVLAIAAVGTLAYLTAQQDGDEAVVNTFVAAELIDNSDPEPDNPDDPDNPVPDVPDDPYTPDNPDDPEDNPDIQNGLKLLETKTVLINGEYVALEDGQYGYSSNGDYVVKVTDEDGAETWYVYDSAKNTITDKTVSDSDVTLISTSTLTNDYTMVVPGTTVPKDPTVSVNIYDGISAYIYIKVTDDTSDYITYSISSDWLKIDSLSSDGESIYIYVGSAADEDYIVTGDSTYELQSVSILVGDEFYVSEELEEGDVDLGDLTFELYVCQASGFDKDYVTAYTTCFGE